MNRCATCKHREEPDEYRGNFSRCLLIPRTADLDHVNPDTDEWDDDEATMARQYPGVFAFTADASTYSSDLYVSPEFGCVHWQAVGEAMDGAA